MHGQNQTICDLNISFTPPAEGFAPGLNLRGFVGDYDRPKALVPLTAASDSRYGFPMEKKSVLEQLRGFVAERDWSKFHSSENLAKSVSIEAAELLELFQWESDVDEDRLRDEIADVLTYCYLLADKHGFDPNEIILQKLEQTKTKYPVEKSLGKSTKYDQL